jgi:hypothetical protein
MRSLTRLRTLYPGLLATAIIIWPMTASAQVKWFVRGGGHGESSGTFSLGEPAVQIWLGILVIGLLTALVLERYLPGPPDTVERFTGTYRQQISDIFQVLVGLALLLTAVKGAILAPHLEDGNAIGLALRFAEGAIGVMLIANKAVPWAAASLIALFAASTMIFGFVSSLEYFSFLGIALFLLLTSSPAGSWADRWRPYAVPLLRVHLGVALGVLAWTEKLIDPALAVRFLEENEVNFMKAIGVDAFSDRLFVLCAGCSELLFALVYASGAVTRINTLALAGFLISSNVYFFAAGKTEEGFLELTGHMPLFAIAMMLIVYGSGGRLLIGSRRRTDRIAAIAA